VRFSEKVSASILGGKMHRLLIAFCSVMGMMAAACSAANAQFYVGVQGGANFVQDSDVDNSGGADATVSFDPGFVVGALAGYRFGLDEALSLDIEGEFSYRLNQIDEASATGIAVNGDGKVQSFVWMANAWLNWHIGDSGFVPYAGGGFGGVHIDIKDAQISGIRLDNQSDFMLGGQLGGGLGYQFDEHFAVSLDYRFLITEGTNFGTLDAEYQNHAVLLGLKYFF
jgi:opacity protein-like surface antigen